MGSGIYPHGPRIVEVEPVGTVTEAREPIPVWVRIEWAGHWSLGPRPSEHAAHAITWTRQQARQRLEAGGARRG